MIHLISLGAGVQSSTMALMAAAGVIKPMPKAAIFADTGWEPMAVYGWLDRLEGWLPFPVHRVHHHGLPLRQHVLAACEHGVKRLLSVPAYTLGPNGERGMTLRHCTRDWKIRPVERKAKELMGHKKHARLPKEPVVEQWLGISLDEVVRAKPSQEAWKIHRFPLLEQKMRRQDCVDWMQEWGYPEPPRSACIGCPYHDDLEWWKIRQDPVAWADAVEVDEKIRKAGGMKGETFLHQSRRPLADAVPVEKPESRGRQMILAECEGMCGV